MAYHNVVIAGPEGGAHALHVDTFAGGFLVDQVLHVFANDTVEPHFPLLVGGS